MSEVGKMSFFVEDVEGNKLPIDGNSNIARAARRITEFLDECADGRLFMSSSKLAEIMHIGPDTITKVRRNKPEAVEGYCTKSMRHASAYVWGNKATIAAAIKQRVL